MKPSLQKSYRNKMVQGFYLKPCSSSTTTIRLAETIASMEELLTEILVRVPARPLISFKCVSKRWLSLISDPKFCHRHTLQNPNSPISAVFPDRSTDFSFIPFPPDHNHISARWNPLEVIANQYGDDIYIMHSCNGLILCRPLGAPSTLRSPYFVLNPTTNRFLTLAIPPCQPVETHILGCFLAFDPSKSPHYKVICLETIDGFELCRRYQIQIYSSETRSWRHLDSSIYRKDRIGYERGVYCNGAIHWVGLYSEMSYFHIDEERVEFVETTLHCYQKKWHEREYRYLRESSGGHLHLIDIYTSCLTNFEVLEMGRDYSGWFVKYHVDLYPLCTAFPDLPYGEFVVLFLDQDENEEDGSLSLLLHSPGNVISCNLKSKTFKSFELTTDERLLVDHRNFMYKETLACV